MNYLKKYENINWDFDEEEDGPFNFDSFRVIDLYHYLGNINNTINWAFDNLMGKKVEVHDNNGGKVFIGIVDTVRMVDTQNIILRRIEKDIDGDIMMLNTKIIYLKDIIKTL